MVTGLSRRIYEEVMGKQRVLITVKTYPTLSKTYGETVCTAGLLPDGSWIRIYPVPFRRLDEYQQYAKYDWIECDLSRNLKDPRPETFRPDYEAEISRVGHMGTGSKRDWGERRVLLLKTARVFHCMSDLIDGAKANLISLAVFKPSKILGFTHRPEEREWDQTRVKEMRENFSQFDLFRDNSWRETFSLVRKLPYGFYYRFEDSAGRQSEMKVLDWEIGALFWNCLRDADGNEQIALSKVRQRYLDEFKTKDLHFFLGTTQQFHQFAPNPWVIVGVLPIPHEVQGDLFDTI